MNHLLMMTSRTWIDHDLEISLSESLTDDDIENSTRS